MERKVLFTGELNAEERAAVIRYTVEIGEKASCRTTCLLRPLTGKLLEDAFRERERKIEERERAYVQRARTFDPAKVTPEYRSFFGGEVTAERFGKYIAESIKQEEEAKATLRRSYHVTVDYAYLEAEDRALHRSLSPRVTFGDSNELHEVCEFTLTRELKDLLMDSSLGDVDEEEGFDYGSFYVGKTPLYYQDLTVTIGGQTVLETVSHEEILDLFLTEEELKAFRDFELNKARNEKIVAKLLS